MSYDEYIVRPCLRSGLCCKTGVCPWGEWDKEKHQCKFLEVDFEDGGVQIHKCQKYKEIRSLPPGRGAEISPAFGAGCCMPLGNTARQQIVRAVKEKRVSLHVITGSSHAENNDQVHPPAVNG